MKKILILWFVILLVVKCSHENKIITDPLINTYKVDNVKLTKDIIKSDLNHFLHKYNRNWSEQNKNRCIELLYKGQLEFDIHYKIVLSIVAIESQFKIDAIGKNKKSIDYGLAQINSRYLKQRYRATEQYLNQHKIKYTDSKFDMNKNIYSCFMYLKNIMEYGDLVQFSDHIKSYNVGIRGCKLNTMQKSANIYYNKFIQEYMSL